MFCYLQSLKVPVFKEFIRTANGLKALFCLLLEGKDNTGVYTQGRKLTPHIFPLINDFLESEYFLKRYCFSVSRYQCFALFALSRDFFLLKKTILLEINKQQEILANNNSNDKHLLR